MSRLRTLTTAAAAVALAGAATTVLAPSPASALPTGGVTDGTAAWGISTYLNSANPGRPNPKPEAYTAPATFDGTSRVSTWAAGTGTVAPDGSADLAFDGTTVNHASTGGGWLRLGDLEVDLDAEGNGTVTAVVAYGTASPPASYDPEQTPVRGPERVDLVDLAGNSAADRTIGDGTATWTGLEGTWAPELLAFLAGDSTADPAIPGWSYASTVTNITAGREPLPFTFTTTTAVPEVAATVTAANPAEGLAVDVAGTGFRAVTNPGDAGVYVGITESGGLPDVSTPAGAAGFVAVAYTMPHQIVDGAFATTLVAEAGDLEPDTDYSVYTWQSHTHSNTTQDTETPLEVDWTAFEVASSTTLTGPATRSYGRTSTLTATVSADGPVTLTGVGAARTVEATAGTASFTLPADLPAGTYEATVSYGGAGWVQPSAATHTLSVTRATPGASTTFPTKPTTARAGRVRVAVSGPAAVAAPSGKVTVRIFRDGASKKVTGTLRDGVVTLAVPKLRKAVWTVVTRYAGDRGFAVVSKTRNLRVR